MSISKYKRSLSLFTLTLFLFSGLRMPFSLAASFQQETASTSRTFPNELTKIAVPDEIGKIEGISKGQNNKVVILIQDAHAIPDAQQNIEQLISHFQKEYGIKSVMVEGAASELDPQIFRSFPDKKILQDVFEEYQKNGELTGSTAAAIFNETASRYFGVEDWNLYEEGLYLYLLAMQSETELSLKLSAYEKDLQAKKQKTYPKNLSEIDAILNSFHENQANLVDVLKKLAAVREPPKGTELKTFLDEVQREGKDQSSVEIDVRRIADQVSKFLKSQSGRDKEKLRQFNEKFQEFQTSRIPPQAFALFLKKSILENHLPLKVSNQLQGLMDQQKTLRQIEGTKLFKDLEAYAANVKESLFQNDEQRQLGQETVRVQLLKKFVHLELSIEDWEMLKKDSGQYSHILASNLLNAHRSFYDNAEKRDHAFASNMTTLMDQEKTNVAILISGGFHTQGVNRELREKGYSCVTVFPQIGSIPQHSLYQDHMAGQVSWKDYLRVEDGKIDVFKAFVRATRDKLLKREGEQRNALLKSWRDRIIRDLSAEEKIESTSQYTQLLDEISGSKKSNSFLSSRLARVDKFIQELKSLTQSNQVTQQNVLQILKAGTILDAFGIQIRHDPLGVNNNGLKYDNGRLIAVPRGKARSEVRADVGFVRLERLLNAFINYPEGDFPRDGSIADIHGNINGLETALKELWAKKVIQTVLKGDYMDGDPHSVKVFRKVRKLTDEGENFDGILRTAIPLMGNHDLMFILAMMGSQEAFLVWLGNRGISVLEEKEVGLGDRVAPVELALRRLMINDPRTHPVNHLKTIARNQPQLIKLLFEAAMRNSQLQEMANWMKRNLRLYHLNEVGALRVHAGIAVDQNGSPALTYKGFNGLLALAQMEEEMAEAFAVNNPEAEVFKALNSKKSPVWIRGWENKVTSPESFVHQLGVASIDVGHTPQTKTKNIDKGRIILADRGIANTYYGQEAGVYFATGGLQIKSAFDPYQAAPGEGLQLVLNRARNARVHARRILESLPKKKRGAQLQISTLIPPADLKKFASQIMTETNVPLVRAPQLVPTEPIPSTKQIAVDLAREDQLRALKRRHRDIYDHRVIQIILTGQRIPSTTFPKEPTPEELQKLIHAVEQDGKEKIIGRVTPLISSGDTRDVANLKFALGKVLDMVEEILAGGNEWDKAETLALRSSTDPATLLRGMMQLLTDWSQGLWDHYHRDYVLTKGSAYYSRLEEAARQLDFNLQSQFAVLPNEQDLSRRVADFLTKGTNGSGDSGMAQRLILRTILSGTTPVEIATPFHPGERRGGGPQKPLDYEARVSKTFSAISTNDLALWFKDADFRRQRFEQVFSLIYNELYGPSQMTRNFSVSQPKEKIAHNALQILTKTARSEMRATARTTFDYLMGNNAAEPAQLSQQITTSYDWDGIIQELERLRDIAREDAKILNAAGSSFLSFGAEQFANEVQVLIDRLKKIPSGYALGFVVPGSPDSNEIQTAVRQIGGLGFRQVFLQGQDRIGLNGLFKNAGLTVNNSGIQKGTIFLSNQKDAGAVVLKQGDLQGVQVASVFTPIVITESEQVENPFIRDYAIVLEAAVALLIAHEGKAALLKNPAPLLEQYGLISSGYSNTVVQSNGNQLFISAIAVKAYLEWKTEQQARIAA